MAPVPLMIMSDAVTSSTGLGRITRDLAGRIHEHLSDVFEVGTFGYGGSTSYNLPYRNYAIRRLDNWVAPELPYCWYDFAGERRGILLAIWNPGWLPWLADPSTLPPSGLRTFLEGAPFEKWIYAPIDAEGIDGKLPAPAMDILKKFDRVLAYTKWASGLIDRSLCDKPEWKNPQHVGACPHLPHGIDTKVFYPRDAQYAKDNFVTSVSGRHATPLQPDVKIIGVVATNSQRKDWGLAFEVFRELLRRKLNFGVWAHTDAFQKHWDLVGMANESGLGRITLFTNGNLSDETMALAYSGCDVTLGIGAGEGWGYPLVESLACGTPVIHGNYAAGAEIVPKRLLVDPVGHKWDGGLYINKRPVFRAADWANKVLYNLGKTGESLLYPKYSWDQVWPRWEKWLVEGVNGG